MAAFDNVECSVLWAALSNAGIPSPIVNLVIDLYSVHDTQS